MLIELLIEQPGVALTIVQRTPLWVWGLLAGLVALALSQWRDRQIGLCRAVLPSLGLAVFSLIGLTGDLRHTAWLLPALTTWLATVGTVLWMGTRRLHHAGTRYDPTTRRFFVPGSAATLWTVLAIFALKYGVGIELALQPELRHSAAFSLTLAALYGALTGLLSWRPLALWRMARQASVQKWPSCPQHLSL